MPETQTVDEVVSNRNVGGARIGGGLAARPVESDSVDSTGASKTDRSGIESDTHSEGGRRGRALKESTVKLLEKIEKEETDARPPAPHEEGDADEEEDVTDEPGDADEAPAEDAGDGEPAEEDADAEEEDADDEADPVAAFREANTRLETRNKELLGELEAARKTPKAQRTERENALIAAEVAYVDEGTVPALRKFLSVITGAAADSKEVDAELEGLFIELSARELGVPLDQNQKTLRDNARTRLLLARDKREKVEEKKPVVDNSAETVQYEQAAKYVDNLLVTKGQSGTSIADEYPMLMTLAEEFDGYKPAEVLARAIRQEFMAGTLDPKSGNEIDTIRTVAQKIEAHYDAVAKKIEAARAKKTKPNTTTPSVKPKAAVEASKEQRQSPGARSITNAAASRAPAKPPKTTKQKAQPTQEKSRKDFKSDAAWREYLLDKHKLT